jgi:hypothetical protein
MPSASFQLRSHQAKQLQALAGMRQVSQSQVVREALDFALQHWDIVPSTERAVLATDRRTEVDASASWARTECLPTSHLRQLRRAAAHLREHDADPARLRLLADHRR